MIRISANNGEGWGEPGPAWNFATKGAGDKDNHGDKVNYGDEDGHGDKDKDNLVTRIMTVMLMRIVYSGDSILVMVDKDKMASRQYS